MTTHHSEPPAPFRHLSPGDRYRVIREFVDFDGGVHAEGEQWTFVTHNLLPYDDGLSLFVVTDDGEERQIRMQWRSEEQGEIIDRIGDYIAPVASSAPDPGVEGAGRGL